MLSFFWQAWHKKMNYAIFHSSDKKQFLRERFRCVSINIHFQLIHLILDDWHLWVLWGSEWKCFQVRIYLLWYVSLFICIFPHCYGRRGYSQDCATVSFDNMIVHWKKKSCSSYWAFFVCLFFNGKTTLEPWFPFSVILLDICKISLSFMMVNGADFPLHATLCCELWLYWTYILSRTCIESLWGSSYGEMGANLELPSAFLGVLNWPDSAKSNV